VIGGWAAGDNHLWKSSYFWSSSVASVSHNLCLIACNNFKLSVIEREREE
jgi:hypothetical protein